MYGYLKKLKLHILFIVHFCCMYVCWGKKGLGFFCFFEQRASFVDGDSVFITYYICNLETPAMGLASSLSTGSKCPGLWLLFHKLPPSSGAPHLTRYQSEAMTDHNHLPTGNHLYRL